ncbi:restriction endonuclease subunit S, partial [Emticicia sp. C21]|uniref:restriction endonuclease subunit S n=1 Tax=Emticicia sp. C21 TaxID=2302915 RepID=UPI000E8D20FF
RIQTQNQIIEKLETLIKGLREQLFNQKVRFTDKDGNDFPNWELKSLKDISQRITEKNSENNLNVLTISAQLGLISQLDFFNKSVSARDISGYYILQRNDFAYNKSYSAGYPMGAIKRLNKYEKGVVSTLYICLRFNRYVNIDFMEHFFESGLQNREIEKIAQEGARNHGLLNVGISDFFDINFNLPSLPEQKRISNLLSSMNTQITLEKMSLEQYKVQKGYLLKNLFI